MINNKRVVICVLIFKKMFAVTNESCPVNNEAQGTGRYFMSWTATVDREAMCFCSTHYIYIDISLLNMSTKYIFRLSSWGWLTCNEHVLLKFLQSWASVVFITITVIVYFNNQSLWRNYDAFWYKCIHYCTWKFV